MEKNVNTKSTDQPVNTKSTDQPVNTKSTDQPVKTKSTDQPVKTKQPVEYEFIFITPTFVECVVKGEQPKNKLGE